MRRFWEKPGREQAVSLYPAGAAWNTIINLTPCLLWQIADYLDRGATDRGFRTKS